MIHGAPVQVPMSRRALALSVLWSYHGTFYSWGGSTPEGFDCSGLVIAVLKSVGILPRGYDGTANDLMKKFEAFPVNAPEAIPGDLVFWLGPDGKASHVEMVVATFTSAVYSMGASGGGSSVTTKLKAMQANAFVKVRPVVPDATTKMFDPGFSHG